MLERGGRLVLACLITTSRISHVGPNIGSTNLDDLAQQQLHHMGVLPQTTSRVLQRFSLAHLAHSMLLGSYW